MDPRPRLPRARLAGRSPRRRALAAAVPIVVAAVIAGGCGTATTGSDVDGRAVKPTTTQGTAPPATTAPTTTTTAPPSPDEIEVRAVMDRFWPAYLEAIAIPDPNNAVLLDLLVGVAEGQVLGRFEAMVADHQRVITPEPSVYDHRIMAVTFPEPDRAAVRECLVDDLQVIQEVQASSGLPEGTTFLVDGDVVTVEVHTSLYRDERGWRITDRQSTEWLEGVRDCEIFSP